MEPNFEANFFTLLEMLDVGNRLEIQASWTEQVVRAEEVIYTQGEHAHSIYIVAEGVVEAVTHSPDGDQTRSMGFMRRGDFFGDLAVLTGQPRIATVRACEATKLLQFEKTAFIRLLDKVPKFGAYFSRNLARRFYKTSTEVHEGAYSIDLSGNLRHFDLLTIFQAIAATGRSGELHLNNSANELIGSFFFREGQADHARYIHLDGIEAIWESIAQSATDGTFTFQVMEKPTIAFGQEHHIGIEASDLLAQGYARLTTYRSLPEPLRRLDGQLGRETESLTWPVPETQPLAEQIWEMLAKRPQRLNSLWRRINYSSLTFLDVVVHLVATGQGRLSPVSDASTNTQPLPNLKDS
jgi:Cyclic nucleotide-binding domain/Domain of unknown function (DUF4388)